MRRITMGSLFDGIGGFPLAAIHNGVIPLWVSEIEPFPIRVTQQRLPGMLHYGDITKLDGAMLPPVDIICGGSPCQDLSVAGARAGLAGERSGLFDPHRKGDERCRYTTRANRHPCSPPFPMLGKCAGSLLQRRAEGRGLPHRPGGDRPN